MLFRKRRAAYKIRVLITLKNHLLGLRTLRYKKFATNYHTVFIGLSAC